ALPEDPESNSDENAENSDEDVSAALEKVYNIVMTKCAKCHQEGGSGGLVLVRDGVFQLPPLADLNYMVHLVEATNLKEGERRMPPSGPLSDDEVKAFKDLQLEETNRLRG